MIGTVDAIAPNWPMSPVSCTITGLRRGGKERLTSLITLMNVIASPAPTSILAASPSRRSSAKAKTTWPHDMTRAPMTSMRLEPSLSTSTPTGICMTA
jgi:hypothetical protein